MARLLGVPAAQISESVLVEYELRLRMFHCDGNSGALGTIGIIDMLRSMKLGPPPRGEKQTTVDWSRIPMNGTVRVAARLPGDDGQPQWAFGVYVGQVGVGKLAVRLDGDTWVHEMRRDDVRIARDEPMEPVLSKDAPAIPAVPKEALVPRKEDEDTEPESSLADIEPWASMSIGDSVVVKEGEGRFQGVQDDEVLVLLSGDLTPHSYGPELVTCLEKQTAE